MRAPVYRNIDNASTFLGLAFPGEVSLVLLVYWTSVMLVPPSQSFLATLASYVALRLASIGKSPQHLQHLVMFHIRRLIAGGRLSPAARVRQAPRFPYATDSHYRDLPVASRRGETP